MRLANLTIYPIKSTRGIDVEAAPVEPWGLAGDRRWVVTDPEGVQVTAREAHALLQVSTALVPGGLEIEGLFVPEPEGGELVPIRVGRDDLTGVVASAEAGDWFSRRLGRPGLRLVWCDDPTRRRLKPAFSQPGDSSALSDAYPLLLATTGSLQQLNTWIGPESDLPMTRFRPNVVVDSAEPFAEDTWKRIRIGEVEFRAAEPCSRCVMTTVDAETLTTGPEPIRTLAKHRRWDGKTWFGMNLIPDGTGELRLGDPVEVLA
ncbi:MOSC domain-containing protein [Longispora albida]|uniref:MOSC domain-containing protein n=1 Tax=Longispora albida TaxID=203523 RepID=UPI000381975B|nr:MOSC domain-containing protein [Longispora albida]